MVGIETRWIWIQIGIALLLVILFMARGKQAGPSRLKLSRKKAALREISAKKSNVPSTVVHKASGERPLNVLFNYNGETFDAFEVLGLPAAAPWDLIERVYREQFLLKPYPEKVMYEAAYRAIEISYKGQRKTS
jgi:hypothetical protein